MPITPTTTVNVRYMVGDVETAIAWYTKHLGFTVLSNAAPAFADVSLGSLRLLLSGPGSSAGRPMPDGARPAPGGWNRIHLIVDDLPVEVTRLRAAGVQFRKRYCDRAGWLANSVERSFWESCGTLPASSSLTATELVETSG
jgi:catechol 2,3-dioxygenase-like lactoylglutathione lyase family enzyme